MNLAIFDLDNTLLGGDSDYLWGEFLVAQGIVDGDFYLRENERYYEEYKAGTLDIFDYQRFCLAPIANREPEELQDWHTQFMTEKIAPIMLPAAKKLLTKHRSQGDVLLIITATNRFITGPIADAFDVENLLATEPEQKDGRYTGDIVDIPCFQDGKVKRLEKWLQQTGYSLAGSWFYSDSHNDLPLLKMVEHPVAVDPDETLESYANSKGWDIISLRDVAAD